MESMTRLQAFRAFLSWLHPRKPTVQDHAAALGKLGGKASYEARRKPIREKCNQMAAEIGRGPLFQ